MAYLMKRKVKKKILISYVSIYFRSKSENVD